MATRRDHGNRDHLNSWEDIRGIEMLKKRGCENRRSNNLISIKNISKHLIMIMVRCGEPLEGSEVAASFSGPMSIRPGSGVVVEEARLMPNQVQALIGNGSISRAIVQVVWNNAAPSFTSGPNQVNTGSPDTEREKSILGWATSISPGVGDPIGQHVTFNVTNDNNSLFGTQPAISPNGTLSYEIGFNAKDGVANVTAVLVDDGGVEHGGVNTSIPHTFTIALVRPQIIVTYVGAPSVPPMAGTYLFDSHYNGGSMGIPLLALYKSADTINTLYWGITVPGPFALSIFGVPAGIDTPSWQGPDQVPSFPVTLTPVPGRPCSGTLLATAVGGSGL